MKLLLIGDVMLGREVNAVLGQAPAEYPWGDTLPLFRAADCRICNLECVISDRGRPWMPKVFHFRSDAKNVAVLKAAGIDAISIANNHSLDYEYDALFEMVKILDSAGIAHAGAGAKFTDAARPAIREVAGATIGLVAFSDNEPDWVATETTAGIFYVPIDRTDSQVDRLFELICRTKKDVDFLIVSAHWGPNWGRQPQPGHIPFAHALIDAGADLVFGHSGHVLQGIEIYKGRPILYCCGNFIDDYAVDAIERNDQSSIFCVEIDGKRTHRITVHATLISDFQARMASLAEATAIGEMMRALCAEFGTVAQWRADHQFLEINLN